MVAGMTEAADGRVIRWQDRLDPGTGEVIREAILVQPRIRHREENFFMGFNFGELAHLGLTQTEFRVLMRLLDTLEFEGPAFVNQRALAEELETSQPAISKALKGLSDKGVIRRGDGPKQWWIEPRYAWKGTTASRRKHLEVVGTEGGDE